MISCFKLLTILYLVLITSYSSIAQTTEDEDAAFQKLKVGDMAPPIKVAKWVTGKPVTGFKKGHYYIVEFGFITCGPCRVAIPHLTALSKKYSSKATVISVFVFDKVAWVEKFVEKMGDKMDYRVAVDMSSGVMDSTWVKSTAKHAGYPKIFIVDKFGKIAWIGNDGTMIEKYLEDVIAGNFDAEKAISKEKEYRMAVSSINVRKHTDYRVTLKTIDSLIRVQPEKKYLLVKRFKLLLYNSEVDAYEYGWQLLNSELKDDESNLNSISYQIPSRNLLDLKLEKPDFNLAIAINRRVIDLSKADYVIANCYQNISSVYFQMGDPVKGGQMMEKAIASVPPDPQYQWVIEGFQKKLEMFKKNAVIKK